jgi:Neuraminidase (sialidase)
MIYDPGPDAQTISNQIVVLPDGVLVNLFDVIAGNSTSAPTTRAVVMRSTDKGVTWSTPIEVAKCLFVGSVDPKNSRPIRAGAVVPAIAADAASGTLYVAWHDARFSGGVRDGIALSRSLDGGMNWSPPMQVNQAPNVQAFTPALAMARSGRLGVSYYDLRNDVASDGSQLLVTRWLATTADGGASWHETALAPPFDLRTAPFAGGYFLGDYAGLVHDGDSFLSLFVMTTGDGANRTGVFLRSARD